jgi:hypothetical protein
LSLALVTDRVELYRPGGLDEYGSREPGAGPPVWAGPGNFQLGPGASDPRAAAGGGRGPHDPAGNQTGVLYLPPDSGAVDGYSVKVRGQLFTLSSVRLVVDPTPGGALDALVATATRTEVQ